VKADNHGIRERNLMKLLLPLGVSEFDIDIVWLATVDSFGQNRGSTAHSSISNRALQPPDPKSESDVVGQILDGICKLDSKVVALRVN